MTPDSLAQHLGENLKTLLAGSLPGEEVAELNRLSGGANNETWRL
jgi:hypothetical protein